MVELKILKKPSTCRCLIAHGSGASTKLVEKDLDGLILSDGFLAWPLLFFGRTIVCSNQTDSVVST